VNNWNQRNVNLQKVVLSGSASELSQSLDEWRRLDITHSSSQLDNADISLFIGIVNGYTSDSLNPVLDLVRKMWDDLNGLSEVFSPSLDACQQFSIYISPSDSVPPSQ
jgi:hypothetical protein